MAGAVAVVLLLVAWWKWNAAHYLAVTWWPHEPYGIKTLRPLPWESAPIDSDPVGRLDPTRGDQHWPDTALPEL